MRGRLAEKPGARTKLAALLLGVLLLSSATAFGAASDFIPVIFSTGGDFELTVLHQNSQNTSAGRGSKSTDSFATERLRVNLGGFVYHPRFILFQVKGAGGLSQERSENTGREPFSENGLGTEYEFRTKILPEHRYNLELYTLSRTPLFRGQSSADTRPTLTEQGAIFNYSDNPRFFNLSYSEGATKTRISSSDEKTARVNGSYRIGLSNNSAAYARTDASTSTGTRTSGEHSSFENKIIVRDLSLDSKIMQDRSLQSSPFSATLDSESLSWSEQFNAALPWNFSTSVSYNARKDARTTEEAATETRNKQANESRSSSFGLAHRLYESVQTSYALNQTSSDTSSGDSKSVTNSVNGVYTKKVPDGRVTIGVRGSRSIVEQDNAPLTVGELYTAPLFGTFTLARESVDPATISIRVLSDANALIDLARDTNYVVESFGNAAVITIVSLPPEVVAGQPADKVYTFQATYALTAGAVKLETSTTGYTINLSLFNNLVSPYYSQYHTAQEVLAGSIPGGARDAVTVITGVAVQKAPYALTSEYGTTENAVGPSRSLRNAAEYSQKVSDTTGLSARAQHTKTVYGEGTLGTSGSTEQVSAFSLVINKSIPRRNLTATAGGSYSQRNATFDTELYALTGSLLWKFRTLTVNMGASFNRAISTASLGKQTLLSEYYYLTVSRKLF